ncbi:hypothetical protein TanjilG_01043 [Lupinus angustifolius]|uniref:Uncharacterized protein n=1 Tax=Lupinus angustifolius TaxID=3871 RepID=A0A4P1QR61_LUPAN|nr:hypothetical protein TanjilG_01043 [Lupinus angustifolius]
MLEKLKRKITCQAYSSYHNHTLNYKREKFTMTTVSPYCTSSLGTTTTTHENEITMITTTSPMMTIFTAQM